MTRINTNVSSLLAQISLARNNNALDTALLRLSTGMRINSAADDPAGLIASTYLSSDIRATEVGIANSELADQMMGTATSGLSSISDLLIDIRGLVNEAASSGTMSASEIAANQIELNAALDAIDRISQSTQFQGRQLLDGSLDFITSGVDSTKLNDVTVNQASFSSNVSAGVNVKLVSQATKGALTYGQGATTDDVVLQVGGSEGYEAFSFDSGTSVTDMASAINLVSGATGVTAEASGVLEWDASTGIAAVDSYGADNDITITASETGEAAGAYYVRYFEGTEGGGTSADITLSVPDAGSGVTYGYIDVTLDMAAGNINASANDVIDAINAEQDALVGAGTISERIFTVANASGSDGTGTVAISEVVATTGADSGQQPDANNMLQYQALDGMRDIQYVASGTNTELSIDWVSDPPQYAQASTVIDLGMANGTFELKAQNPGADGNQDVNIAWVDGGGGYGVTTAAWDSGTSTLTITIGDTDTPGGDDPKSINAIMEAINNSGTAGGVFDAALASSESGVAPDVGDGTGEVDPLDFATYPGTVSLTGGVVSEGTMIVNLATDANGSVTTTANDLIAYIEASAEPILSDFEVQVSNAGSSDGTGLLTATTSNVEFDPPGTTYTDAYATGDTHAANGSTAQFTVTAKTEGAAYDDVLVRVVQDGGLAADSAAVSYEESSNTLLVSYNGSVTAEDVSYVINTDETVGALFEAEPTAGIGSGTGEIAEGDFVYLSGGETRTEVDGQAATGTAGAPMVELLGGHDAGQDVSDAMLTFSAADYGSNSFVSVETVSGTFAVTDSTGATATRSDGTDVDVRINGQRAVGDGLNASLSSPGLQVELNISEGMQVGETTSFSIGGGGAQFQLGLDVTAGQQARIGIRSVSTTSLGGINGHGHLSELRSGEGYDLATDPAGAAAIVNDAIGQVSSLEGQLGSFQSTTLDTNIANLEDMLATLTAAQELIRDTDYAAESSALVRAQILVEASTMVLAIANQQPQNVLSLIQ